MTIELIPAYTRTNDIRMLFSEYTALLSEKDPEFLQYLQIQHYSDEWTNPERKYGYPDGRLYLALCNGQTAGCVALRKLDKYRCEIKRLYVRREFRGNGVGNALTDRLIQDAKQIGYKHILLDTFPFLERAIAMYRARGFREIEKYNDSPMASTIYMKLDL